MLGSLAAPPFPLPFFLSSSPLFYPILSLCIPSLPSCPEYRIMTQFSWVARVSRGMVVIATAPVLLDQPTIPPARVRLHRAIRAWTNLSAFLSAFMHLRWQVGDEKKWQILLFSLLWFFYLISVTTVFWLHSSFSYLSFSCSSLRGSVSNYWFTALVCSDRPGKHNNKPLSASG